MATATKTFAERVKEARTKAEMTEWVQRVYAETERLIVPLKPFIFVRTLPRSTITSSGLFLPEKQNKPNIEAVVLGVFEPYWDRATAVVDGEIRDISVWHECDVKVGDHIIIPHHVGLPDSFLDPKEYRIIREDDAMAKLTYLEKGSVRKDVREAMLARMKENGSERIIDAFLHALFENFDVVPKVMYSRTLSGV